jgi:hypothetical protein
MAIDARDKGDADLADAFTARAAQYLEAATDLESQAGTASLSVPPNPQQHVAQQQQQLQPKKDDDA